MYYKITVGVLILLSFALGWFMRGDIIYSGIVGNMTTEVKMESGLGTGKGR